MSNKTKGIIGSSLVHVILLVLLILFGFTTPLPLPGEQGILINFGTDNEGMGLREPKKSNEQAAPPAQAPVEEAEQAPITQDFEDAPSIEKPKPKPKVKPKEEKKPIEKPKEKEKIVEEKPREVDGRTLFPGKKTDGDTSGEGDSSVKGNQGHIDGSVDSKNREGGIIGGGDGVSFSLGDRGALSLPKPEYNIQESGIVVVEITVDKNGNVTNARGGVRGTTNNDTELIKAAEKAARLARFNVNKNAPAYQNGTITYVFKLE